MPNRILTIAAALLLAALVLAPGLIGRFVEAEFTEAHAPLANALGGAVRIERYERGWFGADATVCADVPAAATRHCADYAIQHGPVLWSAPRGVGWFATRITPNLDDGTRARLQLAFDDAHPIHAALRVGFDQSMHLQLRTAAARRTADDATFEFAPLALDGVYERSQHRLTGSLTGLEIRLGKEYLTGALNFVLDTAQATGADAGVVSLLRALKADGEVRATPVLAERLLGTNGVQQWLKNGLAQPADDELLVAFALTGDKIRVGEREIPVALLLALREAFQ
jgi:hypothetical protein